MKGIRFYQEFENRSKTRPTRNVIAVCLGDGPGSRLFERLDAAA